MIEIGEQFEMTHGYFMELNGWTNCWDAMPEKEGTYLVEDHSGKQGKAEAVFFFRPYGVEGSEMVRL